MSVHRPAFAIVLALALLASALLVQAPRAAAASGPAGTITTPITDTGLDTNGDGLYDYLAVNVTVDVTQAGMFAIRFELAQPADVRAFLDVGLQTIQARVYGWSLWKAGFDGPYTATLTLANGQNLSVLDTTSYTTGAYLAKDFDPPGAIIESVGTAWPVDTNGNGLYDELRLNYTLNVTGAAPFLLEAEISPQYGGPVFWTATPSVGVGVHTLTFSFPGGLINASGMYGVFNYAVFVIQWYAESSYSVGYTVSYRSITTPMYFWDEFDPPWVRIAPPLSEHAVDVDGDGLYEEIVVHVPIHLERASNVSVVGYLDSYFRIQPVELINEALPAGDTAVDLVFPTYLLRITGKNGPYSVEVDLTASVLPGYLDRETFTTAAYTSTQMSPPSASVTGSHWTQADPDADGKIDWLNLSADVTAIKTGDFFVDARIWDVAYPEPIPETGRFVHVGAGTTATVTLPFSGVALNRSSLSSPWYTSIGVARLDSIQGDANSTSAYTAAYAPSDFAAPAREAVNVTVKTTQGAPVPFAAVLAFDPARGFWTWTQANSSGGAQLSLYNGTFALSVHNMGATPEFQPATTAVDVSGPTAAEVDMPRIPQGAFTWDATLTSWNASAVTSTRTWAYANATARIAADLFGNFNGIANATELGWWLRYPFFLPNPYPIAYYESRLFGLAVDGTDLTGGTETITQVQGAGSYASTQPVAGVATSSLRSAIPPAAGPDHSIGVTLLYDQTILDTNLTLHLPASTLSTAAASANVSLFHPDATTWIVDPGRSPTPGVVLATATIDASSVPDTIPPVALFTPGIGEREMPLAFNGSGSADNVGVVNYTWNVTANGTARQAYGANVTFTFNEIGTYVVTLTVRDAAGNTGATAHAVVVRDTTPPPTPTGLTVAVVSLSGGAAATLTWSAVTADDLLAYRVYSSTDRWATYHLEAQLAAGSTTWSGAMPASGTIQYRVTSVDRYGNEAPPSVAIEATVPSPLSPTPPPSPGLGVGILGLIVAIVVVVAVVAAALILRGRREKEPPQGPGPVV